MAVHERLSETQEIVLKNLVIFGLPGLNGTAAWLAQLVGHQSTVPEVEDQHSGS